MKKIIYILIISLTSLFNINIQLTPDPPVATTNSFAAAVEYSATFDSPETAIIY